MRLLRKGQFFSSEVLIAYFIFFLAIIMILVLWNITMQEIKTSEEIDELQEKAAGLGGKLVKTTGIPVNWTRDNVVSLGLASEGQPRILEERKISEFIELMNDSYRDSSHLLGLGKYDFAFNLTDINGTQMEINGRDCFTGRKPENDRGKITVRRTALLDGTIVKVILTVWLEEVR